MTNNKTFIFWWIFLLLFCMWWYYIFYIKVSGIQEKWIFQTGWNVVFSDETIQRGKAYDYYQVYAYPKEYSISCNAKHEDICSTIKTNESFASWYILWYISKDLWSSKRWKTQIEIFNTNEKINSTLNELFEILYKRKDDVSINDEHKKYFSYKNDSLFPNINEMEKRCLEQILMTITEWSYWSEEIIQQRVENECKSYETTSEITQNISWWYENTSTKVSFWLDLRSIKLVYKFFSKSNGNFHELYSHEDIIPFNKKIIKVLNINY